MAKEFLGYWKDVGTTESLWEANMDLLNPQCTLYQAEEDLRVYARNEERPPTFVAEGAVLENAIITKGCEVYGRVTDSVISGGCIIEPGAVVQQSVLLPGVRVGKEAKVQNAIVGKNANIEPGSGVGEEKEGEQRPPITVIAEKRKRVSKTM